MKTTRYGLIAIASLLLVACDAPADAAGKVTPYPLKTCLVSGNELGSMGKPVTKVYGDREIKFCCKPCVKKFEANQPKYLAKLR